MRRRIAALTVAALLTGAAGVSAQVYAPQSLERYFRLEWEVTAAVRALPMLTFTLATCARHPAPSRRPASSPTRESHHRSFRPVEPGRRFA